MATEGTEALKRAVARQAAALVSDGTTIGLGSGSTLSFFFEALAERIRSEGLRVVGVPTSYQARWEARQLGIPLVDGIDADDIDLAIDGADEIDP
ncbi:MAG TPA: ribose-5-phosphate isomerase A, partial [Limnochordia bacterium]